MPRLHTKIVIIFRNLRKISVNGRKEKENYSMDEKKTVNFKSILCGAATGAANGLFGGGGGMIAVPLLRAQGLNEKKAHATAIAVILPVSLLSFILYALKGFFDFSVALPVALGGFAGGFAGAKLLSFLPEKAVFYVFGALQAVAGAWLIFS